MRAPLAEIVSTGRYTPEKVLTNADFAAMVDTNDQWITERTGIKERRISSDEESLAYMANIAGRQALDGAGLTPEDVDMILVATASSDRLLPSTACDLQALIGAHNAAAMDVGAACAGFIYAVSVAEGMIAAGKARNILVFGAERLSRIIDYTDRSTCILFGDGVGAVLVQPATSDRGVMSTYIKSDGRLADLLYRPAGGSSIPANPETLTDGSMFIQMAGREVFKHAVRSMADACDKALAAVGMTGEDIDVMIPHQANIRIIEATAKHAGLPMEKVVVNVDRYGNTSAASIPLALDEEVRAGRIKSGRHRAPSRLWRRFHLGKRGNKMVDCIILCPGQGSQRVGMGKDIATQFPAAREVFEEMDEALGVSLTQIMWEGPDHALTLTHNAQPAILAHSLAVHAVVGDMLNEQYGAGHSLGEYSAYTIAGALSLADAVRLVRRRGELMLEAGDRREGTMAAILGLDTDVVERCCAEASATDDVAVAANINGPDQTVISGDPGAVGRAGVLCKEANAKRVIPLRVSGAFHSPLMEPAKVGLESELASIQMQDPAFPIIANATGGPVTTAAAAREQLARQVTAPVRWVESMTCAAERTDDGTVFLELGPGTVLAGLMRKIVKGRRAVSLGGAEEVGAFLEQRR